MQKVNEMIEYAFAMIGLPYRWGGSNPIDGFDCSGFIQECLMSIGMDPAGDQTAQGLYEHFVRQSTTGKYGPGALVFYGKSPREITHVALMINDTQVIEAGGGSSSTLTREDAAKKSAFVRVREFGHRKDAVAVLFPNYKC